MTTPALGTRCTKARTTQRGLRHAERNSDSPNPNRNVTSSLGTFWTALLYDPAFIAATMQGEPVVKRKALANMYLHTYFPTCCCRAGAPVPPARRAMSTVDAVDGSSTGTAVPWMWVPLRPT